MKKLIALTLAAAMSLALVSCGNNAKPGSNTSSPNGDGSGAAPAPGQTYSISIGHGGAESTAQQVGCLALKEYLEENSNGVFTVNIYPNNSMGNDDEL